MPRLDSPSNIEKNLMFVEEITRKEILKRLRTFAESSEISYFANVNKGVIVIWKESPEIIKLN